MARLYTSGFELGHEHAEGLTLSNTPSVSAARPRTGTYSGLVQTGAGRYFQWQATQALDRGYYQRAWINLDALPSALSVLLEVFNTAGNSCGSLRCSTGGVLQLYDTSGVSLGATSSALSVDTWYCIEFYTYVPTASNGNLAFSVDGTVVQAATSAAVTNVAPNRWRWGTRASAGVDIYYDDICVNDDQGASQNSWSGLGTVRYLWPASDPGTSSANWDKPGGSTSNRHTAVDNRPPVWETYDSAGTSAEDYLRHDNAVANEDLFITLQDYTTGGVGTEDIKVVQPIAITGSSSATNTGGEIGLNSNPSIANVAFPTSWENGVASSTVSTWVRHLGTVAYDPSVTKGNGPVMTLRKTTSTTRVALVTSMALIVDSIPAAAGGTTPRQLSALGVG